MCGTYRGPESARGVEKALELRRHRSEARGRAQHDAIGVGQLGRADHGDLRPKTDIHQK